MTKKLCELCNKQLLKKELDLGLCTKCQKDDSYYKYYLEVKKESPEDYPSFDHYLGANGMCMCECCEKVVEYDEVDENGYCFDCSDEDEEEEEEE